MDQLDEAVEVFGCYLYVALAMGLKLGGVKVGGYTYRFISLVKVVDISVQDLDKELDGCGCLHARVCYPKGALETF